MASLSDLPGSARVLLATFAAQLVSQGVHLPTDPYGNTVSYIAPGIGSLFAWDQPCLALTFDSATQGTPGSPNPANVNPWALTFSATFNIVLLRLVSALNDATIIPDPAAMAADASLTMTDAVSLLRAAVTIKETPPAELTSLPMVIHQVMSVGPEGSIAGNVLQISTVLE